MCWRFGTVTDIAYDAYVCYKSPCVDIFGRPLQKAVAYFPNQITVQNVNAGELFSDLGDSGSMVVECTSDQAPDGCDGDPSPVGLLFAGGCDGNGENCITILNPIDKVLSALGVGFVGCAADPDCEIASGSGSGGKGNNGNKGGGGGGGRGKPNGDAAPLGLERAIAAKSRAAPALFANEGVVGVGVGRDGQGRPVIHVDFASAEALDAADLPASVDGYAVETRVTGLLYAQ